MIYLIFAMIFCWGAEYIFEKESDKLLAESLSLQPTNPLRIELKQEAEKCRNLTFVFLTLRALFLLLIVAAFVYSYPSK